MTRNFKFIVEKHPDGYVAYPLGVQGVAVGQGDTYESALADASDGAADGARVRLRAPWRCGSHQEDPPMELPAPSRHRFRRLSARAQTRAAGGERFAAIETVTWREDWPGKREPHVERARELVAEASADGGRVLVVPARTNAQGPEDELLEGLDYELGHGFAGHPLFVAWLEAQVTAAHARLPLADGDGDGVRVGR